MLQMRKKRQKALFSVVVGRAGLTRPLASPFGPAQALFKIAGAILSNLHRFSSSTTPCSMIIKVFEMITVPQMRKKRQKALFSVVVGRAGFEPATN